jgi:hypothetical protein
MRPPDLSAEAAAARELVDALRAIGQYDDDYLGDTLEGETEFLPAVSMALARIDDLAALKAGCDARVEQLRARSLRLKEAQDRARNALTAALLNSRWPLPLRLPEATVSVSRGVPRVQVVDEAQLPADCFRERVERQPDKSLIAARLAAGVDVPGATTTNAAPALTIRRT